MGEGLSISKRVRFGDSVQTSTARVPEQAAQEAEQQRARREQQREQSVEQLLDMAVVASREEAETALSHNHGDLERAVNWLLQGGLLELERRAASSARERPSCPLPQAQDIASASPETGPS